MGLEKRLIEVASAIGAARAMGPATSASAKRMGSNLRHGRLIIARNVNGLTCSVLHAACITKEPLRKKQVLLTCATSENSDQTAHLYIHAV